MHELAVTQELLRLALAHAEEAGAEKVTELQLVVGDLASIVDDCVQFYWDIISEGTLAQGARLRFRRIPAAFRCRDCGWEYPQPENTYDCPQCGGSGDIAAGLEFQLEAIEIDRPEASVAGGDP